MLNEIRSPEDVKRLTKEQKTALAREIREKLIETVSETGGHLASNLGTVELTIALHCAFNAPTDKIVFDVGHQSYTHKMLTGRAQKMDTLRQKDGVSGFPRISESEYDTTNAGHASDAISLALGMARARDLRGEKHAVVVVTGDGAMTGGMCYEALNDAGESKTRLIIILNDNEMSISPNVGSFSRHLTHARQSNFYRSFKQGVRTRLSRMPHVGGRLHRVLSRVRDSIKSLVVNDFFFDSLNIEYLGPIDGHDIDEMTRVFRSALRYDEPVLIHVVTHKGRGYAPAEEHPDRFHGITPFEKDTGELKKEPGVSSGEVAAQTLAARAETDGRIVCVSAAMLQGTGIADFQSRFPERCFDVGIAEEHAVAMAAGLALGGLKPYVAIYSTFLQRAYDQTAMNVSLNGAPVTLLVDRAGLNGADGETHQGVFDIGFLRAIPGLTLASPRNTGELKRMLELSYAMNAPFAVRYPKKLDEGQSSDFHVGEWEEMRSGRDVCLLACGRMVQNALDAAKILEERGISAQVVNARFLSPMDERVLAEIAASDIPVETLEDGMISGGFGEGAAAAIARLGGRNRVVNIGVPRTFVAQAAVSEQMRMCGMDAQTAADAAQTLLEAQRESKLGTGKQ